MRRFNPLQLAIVCWGLFLGLAFWSFAIDSQLIALISLLILMLSPFIIGQGNIEG